jgi:hypothetical protein
MSLICPLLSVGVLWAASCPAGRAGHWRIGKRRRIETVLGQQVERYHLKCVWARDVWHLWSRWLRTVVSHTLAVLLCQQRGMSPLQFDKLLTD